MARFVIMLDDYIDSFHSDWPISAEDDDKESLSRRDQHDGNPQLIPKDSAGFKLLESKSLIHNLTGRVDAGALYERL